jgi:polysaccharide deacetylase 2 family uncharacterized protein YibQ
LLTNSWLIFSSSVPVRLDEDAMHTVEDLTRPLGLREMKPQTGASRESLRTVAMMGAALASMLAAGAIWFKPQPVVIPPIPASITEAAAEPVLPEPPVDKTPVIRVGYPSNIGETGFPSSDGSAPTQTSVDPRLVENSPFGLLPRLGLDGAAPADIYARPAPDAGGRPRIALVVGGLGINEAATRRAIEALGADVTLGFAPYGNTIADFAEQARADGREIWLQLPMETLNPDNNPGPDTLLATDDAATSRKKLLGAMGRFTGYVGVMNYLGERMLTHEPALGPVLKEIASRGLLFGEDAVTARSLVPALSRTMKLRNIRADIVLDADPSPAAIDAALARLEALAKKKGTAIGTATALPVSVDKLSRWTAKLEAKGIVLVPMSSLARR